MFRGTSADSGLILSGAIIVLLGPPVAAQTVNDPGLQVETVASGLARPTSMAFVRDFDILVLQKDDGQVRRIINGSLQPGAALDVAVDAAGKRGLLGIALDPDFPVNGHVFLYFTESSTGFDTAGTPAPLGNRVYRYTWNGSALVDPVLILDLPAASGPDHNGGVLTFGPDGALYAVIGDLGRDGRLQNNPFGADPDDSGVIFRVDIRGAGPADNPFFNPADPSDPLSRYVAYGIHNSFGLAIDPVTGALWDTENGHEVYDEVNRVAPGFNSGWTPIMGPDDRDPEGQADLWVAPGSAYSDPEFSWRTPVAPTALAFAASPILGCSLLHDLLVGDVHCGQIYRFEPSAARDGLSLISHDLQDRVADNGAARCSAEMSEIVFGAGFGAIADLENGPDGRLYVVSPGSGTVSRIGPRPGAFPDQDRDGAGDACDCAPSDARAFSPPAEVPRLRAGGDSPTTLTWDVQAGAAGPGTTYDVVTGDAASLRRDGGFASACTLGRGLPGPSLFDARPDPPPGAADYFLVRDDNPCGRGTFGDGSGSSDPRDPLDAAAPSYCLCGALSGGAVITFAIRSESLTVWITNGAVIDRAEQHLAAGSAQIPVFGKLLDGPACDPQWSWHVDPENALFADGAIELCDGLPSHIEGDPAYWLGTVGSYCPWSAVVTAVDDRR